MKRRIYITANGYWVKIHHGGYGAEDMFRASTNDTDFYSIIEELKWRSENEAQKDLDDLAIRYNLKVLKD